MRSCEDRSLFANETFHGSKYFGRQEKMPQLKPRYTPTQPPSLGAGWTLDRLTPVSYMCGANGLRTGPDNRVYIAECVGSRISALNPDTGDLETITPMNAIAGP